MNSLCFILGLTIIVLVNAKPQGLPSSKQDSPVKVDLIENKELSRTLLENSSQTKSRAQNTKEILDKISKLNTELGYSNNKGLKSIDYDEVYSDGYNRALQSYTTDPYHQEHFYTNKKPEMHQATPFDNPITEYLKSLNEKNVQNTIMSYSSRNSDTNNGNYENEDNAEDSDIDDDIPKGHVIKRKIIHRQNIMIPNPFMNQFRHYPIPPMQQSSSYPNMPFLFGGIPIIPQNPQQMLANYEQQPYNYENPKEGQITQRQFNSSNQFAPYPLVNFNGPPQGRQLSWPFQSYFPIVINDPFFAFYNAFSQMIEYGPEADLCKRVSNIFRGKPRPKFEENSFRAGKLLNSTTRKTRSTDDEDDISDDDSRDEIVIDQLALHTPKKKLFGSFFKPRKIPDSSDEDNLSPNAYTTTDTLLESENDSRGPGSDKTFFSKDNMGNGIFIHKLKVRKGGVAIAGPGGIATAGSGGTAVVGPGGYAYTQPDGVAIAGPGTKVFSIPQMHNLTEIVLKAHADGKRLNDNGEPRSLPPGSKIVATGPIVYHNTGNE